MNVVVQHLESSEYLGQDGNWVLTRVAARLFTDWVQAITFCIQKSIRTVRLVAQREPDQQEMYFYPFGGDPLVRAERKQLRKSVARSQQLKAERRVIQARIDGLLAASKENKKQVPFDRGRVADQGPATA